MKMPLLVCRRIGLEAWAAFFLRAGPGGDSEASAVRQTWTTSVNSGTFSLDLEVHRRARARKARFREVEDDEGFD